jgi:glutathione S-transferase
MITLYDADRCPYCARTRIVLAEKGVEHETVVIDLDDRPAWIYEKNPVGRVPVVNEYLEERYPDPPLLPPDPAERALARMLVFRFDDLSRPYYALRRGDADARERLDHELGKLDALLEAQAFLTGRAFGLADAAYIPWILRARDRMGIDLHPFPALVDWVERVAERPSVAAEIDVVATL